MWHVTVCDCDEREREQLINYVLLCYSQKGLEIQAEGCADWLGLAEKLRQQKQDIVIVAQDGVEGMNTITSARPLSVKLIWFSDLDFGVQAYRLCVNYFGRKPVSYQKMKRALDRCMEPEEG
ncbi:MAG: hypothetical protein UDG86_02350 [Lachnospiraceae bacterium]|nr:hypothetical protein [Lachnospiraceae bacterium]